MINEREELFLKQFKDEIKSNHELRVSLAVASDLVLAVEQAFGTDLMLFMASYINSTLKSVGHFDQDRDLTLLDKATNYTSGDNQEVASVINDIICEEVYEREVGDKKRMAAQAQIDEIIKETKDDIEVELGC